MLIEKLSKDFLPPMIDNFNDSPNPDKTSFLGRVVRNSVFSITLCGEEKRAYRFLIFL